MHHLDLWGGNRLMDFGWAVLTMLAIVDQR